MNRVGLIGGLVCGAFLGCGGGTSTFDDDRDAPSVEDCQPPEGEVLADAPDRAVDGPVFDVLRLAESGYPPEARLLGDAPVADLAGRDDVRAETPSDGSSTDEPSDGSVRDKPSDGSAADAWPEVATPPDDRFADRPVADATSPERIPDGPDFGDTADVASADTPMDQAHPAAIDGARDTGPDDGPSGESGPDDGPPLDRPFEGCDAEPDDALCSLLWRECGSIDAVDRCGRSRHAYCGSCPSGLICNSSNRCACERETVASFCSRHGKTCGTFAGTDNCGWQTTADCGSCATGQRCNVENRCECEPESDAAFCGRMGKTCGPAAGTDNCQRQRSVAECGSCDDGDGCTNDACESGICRHHDTRGCLQSCQSGGCVVADTDGDGLNDVWETSGYVDVDCNGEYDAATDTPLPGADVKKPNLYVKWDYMEVTDGDWPHSHKPPDLAMTWAHDVLDKYGILLGTYPDHDVLVEHDVVSASPPDAIPACAGSDAISFYTIKAEHFPARLAPAYHYGVFVHNNTCSDDRCPSCPTNEHTTEIPSWMTYEATGIAVMPGRDFIVSFGSLDDGGIVIPDLWFTGAFLHQLGHNAGLHNGGGDDLDYKPNYISLMNGNYARGISRIGPWNPSNPWSAIAINPATSFDIDFSSFVAATLHEGVANASGTCIDDGSGGLSEIAGVATPEGYPNTAIQFTGLNRNRYWGPAGGHPIDWNVDHIFSPHLFRDISGDGKCSDLVGYSDMELAPAAEGVIKLAHWQPNAACAAGYWSNGASPP